MTVSRGSLGRIRAQIVALRKALVPQVAVFRVLQQGEDESDESYAARFDEATREATEAERTKGTSFLIIVDDPGDA